MVLIVGVVVLVVLGVGTGVNGVEFVGTPWA